MIEFAAGVFVGVTIMVIVDAWGRLPIINENAELHDRIDRAINALTPKSAHIGKKMAKILKGEI